MMAIIRRELKLFFDHPTGYILLVVFLALNSFFFFRSVFIQQVASLWSMFDFLPWLLLFFVSAVTMRMISEEAKLGTLDLLLSEPIPSWRIVLAKWLSSVLIFTIAFLLTLPIPITLSLYGAFDWGQVMAQYIAAVLLAGALSAIGLAASSMTKNQVVAFILAIAASFLLLIAGFEVVVIGLSGSLRSLVGHLSLMTHYTTMTQGVFDTRDVVYIISFILAFLSVGYWFMARSYLNHRSANYRRLKLGVLLIVIAAVVINLLGDALPGRIDATSKRLYTLSSATREIVRNVDDIVSIDIYASESLPPEYELTLRDVKDVVRDIQRAGGSTIQSQVKTVAADSKEAQEAQGLGITPVNFQTLSQQELKVQQGYLGLVVRYANKHETIPFIQNTSDLEYQIASVIRKMTIKIKKHVVFSNGSGEKEATSQRAFRQELEKMYDVSDLDLSQKESKIPDGTDILIVDGPSKAMSKEARSAITGYIDRGGSALLLIDQIQVPSNQLTAQPNPNSAADLTKRYGVEVNNDLVYDLRSNEKLTFGGGFIEYTLPYPFWLKAIAQPAHPISSKLETVVLPWASSLTISTGASGVEPIIKTTQYAGLEQQNFNLMPDAHLPSAPENLKERLLAVAIAASVKPSGKTESPQHGRLVVIGDADVFSDQFAASGSSLSPNIVFGLNSIDWLSQDESLLSIRSKSRLAPALLFENELQRTAVRLGNLVGMPLLVALFGLFHLWRRRRRMQRIYE